MLYVALGGALGASARYAVSVAVPSPWATLAVNVAGCFLAGWLSPAGGPGRLLLVTGFCGGFTTFSAFGVETVELSRAGDLARAGTVIALNLGLGLGAVLAGGALRGR